MMKAMLEEKFDCVVEKIKDHRGGAFDLSAESKADLMSAILIADAIENSKRAVCEEIRLLRIAMERKK